MVTNNVDIEKKKNFIINVLYFVIVTLILFVVVKFGIPRFMPFIIGFGVAFILKPVIKFVSNKTKISRKPVAAVIVLLFYAIVCGILGLIGTRLFIALKDIVMEFPQSYAESIKPGIYDIFNKMQGKILKLDPSIIDAMQQVLDNLSQSLGVIVSKVSSALMNLISYTASSVPSFFVSTVFAIISSFFFATDYQKITGFILRQFSDRARDLIFDIKEYIVGTIFKFIKAYGMLMGITFIELCIGFLLLRVENAIVIAAIIALLDVMPVLGTGGVVIPWIVIELIKGNVPFAIGLVVIYIVITVVRNILEPKIVGEQVGLHPLIMLICMFVGAKLLGIMGIFILPILVIIIKNLNDNGKIHIFK